MSEANTTILLTGATGFVGGRLLKALLDQGYQVRCLVRSKDKFRKIAPELDVELVQGDLLARDGLDQAMQKVTAAYYLVHSMGASKDPTHKKFIEMDRRAAANFVGAAETAGVERIMYLGGLGEVDGRLSKHLSSRMEVSSILSSKTVKTTTLRAAVIIGAGGASFEMIRYLVERLPIMTTPRWVMTRCQPIAVTNVIEYLVGCLNSPETAGKILDICGPDIVSYRELMHIYARVRGLIRMIIPVPVLTPTLSSYWVDLVTPIPSGVVRPLIEGLKNEVICKDNSIRDMIPIKLLSMEEAICQALAESKKGPGALPSQQACFFGKRQ
jgi:uncharacterized protein YbjT (DUF2867 family)